MMKHSVLETEKHQSKGVMCISSIYRTVPAETLNLLSNDESNPYYLGDALESFCMLLEMVFEYLDRNDLERAKLVNSTWDAVATRELRKRLSPSWLEFCVDPMCLRVSHGFIFNSVSVGILTYNPQYIKLPTHICLHRTTACDRMQFQRYLAEELMRNKLQYLTLKCSITCSRECSRIPSTLNGFYCKSAFQCILFPKIPNVEITMYYCAANNSIPNLKKSNEVIKCALIFCERSNPNAFKSLRNKLLVGQTPESMVVGGGLIEAARSTLKDTSIKRGYHKDDIFCLIFTQEKDVEADFNSYIHVFRRSANHFESDLLKFKSEMTLRAHGVLFRFCCCEKNDGIRETDILSKHFSMYQLLGLEVNGEIGWDLFDSLSPDTGPVSLDFGETGPLCKIPRSLPPLSPITLHSFTTVLMLITWGPKVA